MWIIWPFRKKNFGSAWTISSDYRRFIDANMGRFLIQDESTLPHPKDDVFESLCILLMSETDQKIIDSVNQCAFELAFFQKDVGERPLHPLGIETEAFETLDTDRFTTPAITDPSGKERYDRFKRLRDADWDRMKATMAKLRRKEKV